MQTAAKGNQTTPRHLQLSIAAAKDYIGACGLGEGGGAHRAGLRSSWGRLGRADAHGVEARAALARDAYARLRRAQRCAHAGQRGVV